MHKIEFTVPGQVAAKGRPRFAVNGKYVRAYTPEKTVNYENLVKMAFMQSIPEGVDDVKLQGAIRAEFRFFFPIPKSTPKKKHEQMAAGKIKPTKKPDLDNCIKSVLDALNKIAFDDDGQVVEVLAYKFYSENPRAVVFLEEI